MDGEILRSLMTSFFHSPSGGEWGEGEGKGILYIQCTKMVIAWSYMYVTWNLDDNICFIPSYILIFPSSLSLWQFLCIRNIRIFLQACSTVFNIGQEDLFEPMWLYEATNFKMVSEHLCLYMRVCVCVCMCLILKWKIEVCN